MYSRAVSCMLCTFVCAAVGGQITIATSLSQQTTLDVPELWSTLIFWDYTAVSQEISSETLQKYPFIKTIEFFTATGGCYEGFPKCPWTRDLLVDPKDPTKGYNFSPLLEALKFVVKAELQPYIVTGNVPISFSENPTVGAFSVNTQPPVNYTQYKEYISSLVKSAVDIFGLAEVQKWKWGVLTEYNNPDWFINSPEDYLKLYDFTECAITEILGKNIIIGAHACTQCESSGWDPMELVKHAKNGVNFCTGNIGSRISFLSNSFYESNPGNPGDLSWFAPVEQFWKSIQDYFPGISFGIDEGRILFGNDNLSLLTRAVGSSYQGSFDAFLFWKMVNFGMNYYARWGITTNGGEGVFSWKNDADPVATQVAQLCNLMSGEKLLKIEVQPGFSNSSFISAVASVNLESNMVHILAFRHPFKPTDSDKDTLNFQICGIPGNPTNAVTWIVDDENSNFWPFWEEDKRRYNLSSYLSGWSPECEQIFLTNQSEINFLKTRIPFYQTKAKLSAKQADFSVNNGGCVDFSGVLVGHAVQMWQIAL